MRNAEILGLRWREVRIGRIYLPGERTKNGKPREIPVSDPLAEELPRIKAAQGGERVITMSNLVFSTPCERHTTASHQKMAGTDDCTLIASMGHFEC